MSEIKLIKCSICEKRLPKTAFWKDKHRKSGTCSRCKVCDKFFDNIKYHFKKTTIPFKLKKSNSSKRWASNPENVIKVKAHTAVQRALKSGILIRPDKCERCNKNVKLYAHHADYKKPLSVEWLCVVCHEIEHHVKPHPHE